jgi:hypothetical protein
MFVLTESAIFYSFWLEKCGVNEKKGLGVKKESFSQPYENI